MSYGINAPQGLQPMNLLSGATWNGQLGKYFIQSGYNTSLFYGDPVYVAGGELIIATAGAGNPILGVFAGVTYTPSTGGLPIWSQFWAANTTTYLGDNAIAYVIEDPNMTYNIQCVNNALQGIQEADLYKNANLFAGAGSTISGQSGWGLDQTTIGAGATKQLKIIRLVENPLNKFDAVGAAFPFNNVQVVINNDYFKGGTGTTSP